MTSVGGWARDVRDKPNLRVIFIPITITPAPGYFDTGYTLPKGCRILSHSTLTLSGCTHMKLIVDISQIEWRDEPQMPADWDYRNLLRGDVSPVRHRGARAASRRKSASGEGH